MVLIIRFYSYMIFCVVTLGIYGEMGIKKALKAEILKDSILQDAAVS